MKICSVVLTFESVDEILWCDHSNETSSAVLLHGTVYFSIFYNMNFGIFLEFLFWTLLGVKGLTVLFFAVANIIVDIPGKQRKMVNSSCLWAVNGGF